MDPQVDAYACHSMIVCMAMISVVPITPENVSIFKTVRLCALQESPGAFGSTYAREAQFSDAEWLARALKWDGERGIGFMARDGEHACGMAGCFLDEHDPIQTLLVAMWTAPTHRQRGVGRLLVDAVVVWSQLRGARILNLMVTSSNDPAILFYERLGFTKTGRTAPYPNDPALFEYEMARPIG